MSSNDDTPNDDLDTPPLEAYFVEVPEEEMIEMLRATLANPEDVVRMDLTDLDDCISVLIHGHGKNIPRRDPESPEGAIMAGHDDVPAARQPEKMAAGELAGAAAQLVGGNNVDFEELIARLDLRQG